MAKDLLTNEDFEPKRITQKFVEAKNRIKYHNNKAKEFRDSIAKINKPLIKNIKILNELMQDKEELTFHEQFLLGKGYEFGIYSHIEFYDNKNVPAIHHFILIRQPNNFIEIIKNIK